MAAAERTALLVLGVFFALQCRPVLGQLCRDLADQNMACLANEITLDSNCNMQMDIYEDCPVGEPIFTIEGTGLSLGDCTGTFQIVDGSKIALKESLDSETSDSLICITFLEGDDDFGPIIALVNAIDVNEYPPVLLVDSPLNLEIDEDNDVDQVLLTFSVTDQDSGEASTLTFTTDFDDDGTFVLANDGECEGPVVKECSFNLIAKQILDYEVGNFFQLLITFTSGDERGNSSSVNMTILIFVQDLADSPPIWIMTSPSVNVPESDKILTDIFQVKAIDRDTKIDNEIKYEIISGDEGLFTVDPKTGFVSATQPLDRETMELTFFTLTLSATEVLADGTVADEPNNSITSTNIQVTDVNDNIPTFSKDPVAVSIPELTSSSITLSVTIEVTDMDQGEAGQYVVTSSDNSHLTISNPTNGEGSQLTSFTLTAVYLEDDNIFDYETAPSPPERTFTLTATEAGDVTRSSTMTLVITIVDENDNAPKFTDPEYSASLSEDAKVGDAVITLVATDADLTPGYGTPSIRYYSVDCDPNFSVAEETGVVTVSADSALDYETTLPPTISCSVEARDSGGDSSALTVKTTLTVSLEDVNDTPPRFTDLELLPSQ